MRIFVLPRGRFAKGKSPQQNVTILNLGCKRCFGCFDFVGCSGITVHGLPSPDRFIAIKSLYFLSFSSDASTWIFDFRMLVLCNYLRHLNGARYQRPSDRFERLDVH